MILEDAAKLGASAAALRHGVTRFSIYSWQRKLRLAAEGEGEPPTEVAQPSVPSVARPKRGGWVLGAAAVVAVAGVTWFWPRSPEEVAPTIAPSLEAVVAPEVAPVVAPEPVPAVPSEPTPVPAVAPEPTPSRRAPSPSRAAPTAAPAEAISHAGLCYVDLQGEDLEVVLRNPAGEHPVPGWVPPGTYTITAVFPEFGRRETGTATAVEGAGVTIRCDSKFGRCEQR